MVSSVYSENIWSKLYVYSFYLLPVGLLFGEVPTSVAEFIILGCWLLSKQWKNLSASFYHPYFILLSSVYLLHIAGLLYTTDYSYALNDLRIKIPLVFFPIMFFSSQIEKNHIVNLLKWYVVVVFINLAYLYAHCLWADKNLLDTRNVSLFISHIRLGLISAFAIVVAVYLVINSVTIQTEKLWWLIISTVILVLMMLLGLFTGIVSLVWAGMVAVIYLVFKKSSAFYVRVFLSLLLLFFILSFIYIKKIYNKYFPKIEKVEFKSHTLNYQPYRNEMLPYTENGHLVMVHICNAELKKEWEKRSELLFDGKDKKGNELKYTMYRYLASKGLTKDSAGIAQLSNKDIKNIENGVPNYLYAQASFLEKRIYEFIQEYKYFQYSKDPNGKTLVLRLFYWKIGWQIWMKNFWLGVGTGDVKQSFEKEYQHYSFIQKESQLRAHNQFITIALTFGILGLFIFLLVIFYPLIHLLKTSNYLLYLLFTSISILSFFIDDTLETQPGVTFYAFFNTLLIYYCWLENKVKN